MLTIAIIILLKINSQNNFISSLFVICFKMSRSHNFFVVNLEIKHLRPMQTYFWSLVIPWRDNFSLGIRHWFSNFKVPSLDIKTKRWKLTIIHTKVAISKLYSELVLISKVYAFELCLVFLQTNYLQPQKNMVYQRIVPRSIITF